MLIISAIMRPRFRCSFPRTHEAAESLELLLTLRSSTTILGITTWNEYVYSDREDHDHHFPGFTEYDRIFSLTCYKFVLFRSLKCQDAVGEGAMFLPAWDHAASLGPCCRPRSPWPGLWGYYYLRNAQHQHHVRSTKKHCKLIHTH